ncbi:pyridoxamine 5'-phosphate oxidase family protein [Marinomonas mediterranea]|jgi:Predicted flavin-nucleotide-binding protein|uniref:Pyridoxamine 5'-phosphate oxidase-related FMN-binding protein n=1 Tax=Marinomonas mediterranea (strain ATCC 700492 / JCM 21426 / NBRC 103028 / MMB-1) TaxID=717774 RepID=F2JVD0_MARM1|nr:pyridoxamine 5'-phosphate oxidase family protein [Marinomonas mediterranea]ADZ89388.1 hypothetical protein Marme_0082 [Marinomonas mediterranea MMB-1]WCN07487.1 pyridoxamine 5'-phosphate oxidase family protein [Marinomonas mediterranea]WCN11584.1 pyridoxamine 5'-phosphate oxidase family protein [Marinomonas mediterranea]WCN15650.1 pyridoxamine 5'-phosphate oxidase family protein [Marinomonas mediterranea MMB-1]
MSQTSQERNESIKTELSTVKRGSNRALYDTETVYKIIDETLIGHIAQSKAGQVFVTPTCHWRDGEYLYWHAHSKARNVRDSVKEEKKICFNICALDGLVLARSAFHHSVNYRSISLFGVPELIENDDEKVRQFKNMLDKVSPNRWDSLRPIKDIEIKATGLARIKIEEASVKMRAEGVNDDEDDLDWPVWAGVLPLERSWGKAEQDSGANPKIDMKEHQSSNFVEPTPPSAF